jgi:DnaJ-class molecular chaperone
MAETIGMSLAAARGVLGVPLEATMDVVRAAYLEKVRQHPPDRDPEVFEQVRDAYTQLRDPRQRVREMLDGPDPFAPLAELAGEAHGPRRAFVGVEPWLAALKEKAK